MTAENRRFDIEERMIDFAVPITVVVESLPATRVGHHIAGQLLRSGTSPAPNYGEAQAAESRRDFIHKMKVSLKELRESLIWLKIIERRKLCDPNRMPDIVQETNELERIS